MNFLRLFFTLFLFFINLNATIVLTADEKEWIINNPIVKVGVDENWPPFDFIDNSKKHQGIASEYLNKIASSTGLNFEIYPSSWKNVMDKIKKKDLSMLACAANTLERRKYLDFTESYVNVDIVVVAKKGLKLNTFDDIKNYTIALPKNNFVHEKLKRKFPKMRFRFTDSNESAIKAISYGIADIYVGNLPVVSYYIDKYFLTNIEIKFKSDFEAAKLSLAVLKEHDILLSILKKGLNNISFEEKQRINRRWVFENEKRENNKSFSFTQEELNWIGKNEEIKIGGDSYWHPYSFYNEKGKYVGIVPDIINLIKEQSGLNFKYIKTKTWSDTLSLIKDENLDMVDAISYTKNRSDFMNFSMKYFATDIVILGNSEDEKYINSIEEIINKYKIGTVKNYAVAEAIKKDFPDVSNFSEYDKAEDGLKALSINQIDYFILDIPSFEYYSRKFGLSNIKILGPAGYHFSYGLGVDKNNKILLSILNKVLRNIPKEEIDKIYRKWVKINYENKIDYDLIWKIILGSLFVLSGSFYWNRKLKIEIEEKQIAQEKLAENSDFISAIMNSQLDIIVVTNGKEIKQVNQAFNDVLEFKDLEEFKKEHRCIYELFDIKNEKDFLVPEKNGIIWIDEILQNPSKSHKVKIVVNNKEYIFKVVASKIKNNAILKTAVFHDITEVENLHKDLVVAKDNALNATKHKTEFLANMSHEIRTPMNSVIGFTDLLAKEIKDPIQRDYLNSIQKGGVALLAIINDILDLSKIEAGKMSIKNESISLKNLITEIESIFHSKIISKNVNFLIDIDKNIPDFIIIDSVRLRQILFNLIGNAIKFTEQGSIALKVQSLYKDKIKSKIDLVISIKDTGTGIEEEELKNIFNAFEQQSNQDTKYGGTGLGLAICSKLVSMMNGDIYVESKKALGSTFSIYFRDIAVSSVGEQIIAQKLDYANIVFDKATILVVDDIEANRKLVKASLKDFDFKIIMAENGKVALDRLKNINVDLILMDLRMPVLNGYETARIIKNDNKLRDIPLLALTASVMAKDLKKTNKLGFDGYLRKPVILNSLIEKIAEFLPYKFLENNENGDNDDMKEFDLKLFDELIEILDGNLKIENKAIKDKGDFLLIDSFFVKLEEASSKIEIKLLSNYIEELRNNIKSFDIEKVDFLMNSYEDLVKKLILMKKNLKDNVTNG